MYYEIPDGVVMTPELQEKSDMMYVQGFENPVQMALSIKEWKRLTCSFCGESFLCPLDYTDTTLCAACQDD